jgi:hypothetical protein
MRLRAIIRESLWILAIAGTTSMALLMTTRANQARSTVRLMTAGYQRALVQDRLIGMKLNLAALGAQPPQLDQFSLAWFVDLGHCTGCFDSLNDWAHLEQDEHLNLVLFVAGDTEPAVEKRLRVLRRTAVVRTGRSFVRDVLGFTLPNTKLMVDPTGTVVLADSRYSGQECGWSFEVQVAVLRGLERVRAIRSVSELADE